MSIAVQIADSLAAALSAYPLSMPVAASRKYVPDYDGTELQSLRVAVVPGPIETERVARGQDLFTHSVMVMIGKATDGSNEQIDPLMQLCEEIMDAIRSGTLGTAGMPDNAKYFGSTFDATFDRDNLNDRRMFLAQIGVTYRVPREHVLV
jgi:hypothetical protein